MAVSSLGFMPALSYGGGGTPMSFRIRVVGFCAGGRLSCVDRWVVRIWPHHLDGGGQVSWVNIGPHPSTEGRGQDGGGQSGGGSTTRQRGW